MEAEVNQYRATISSHSATEDEQQGQDLPGKDSDISMLLSFLGVKDGEATTGTAASNVPAPAPKVFKTEVRSGHSRMVFVPDDDPSSRRASVDGLGYHPEQYPNHGAMDCMRKDQFDAYHPYNYPGAGDSTFFAHTADPFAGLPTPDVHTSYYDQQNYSESHQPRSRAAQETGQEPVDYRGDALGQHEYRKGGMNDGGMHRYDEDRRYVNGYGTMGERSWGEAACNDEQPQHPPSVTQRRRHWDEDELIYDEPMYYGPGRNGGYDSRFHPSEYSERQWNGHYPAQYPSVSCGQHPPNRSGYYDEDTYYRGPMRTSRKLWDPSSADQTKNWRDESYQPDAYRRMDAGYGGRDHDPGGTNPSHDDWGAKRGAKGMRADPCQGGNGGGGSPEQASQAPKRQARTLSTRSLYAGEEVVTPEGTRLTVNAQRFDVPCRAKFFIIKSFTMSDVRQALKHSLWASTEHGNQRLQAAYDTGEPVYMYFSVNGSGFFCGMAQMASTVDKSKKSDLWNDSRWGGSFRIHWLYLKDVPNKKVHHLRVGSKSVTRSRDAQEMLFDQGKLMAQAFVEHRGKSTLLEPEALDEETKESFPSTEEVDELSS